MSKLGTLFVSSPEKNRNNNINAIRFVSAAMVIYGHMGHLAGWPVPLLFGIEVSAIAVKVFFVLSGYLIAQSLSRDGHLFRYGVRRVFRIFPGLLFVCFVLAFVAGPFLSNLDAATYFSSIDTYKYFAKNSLMKIVFTLPGVFEDNIYPAAVNGSLWTLPIEFSMYILLPFLVMLFKKLHCLKPGIALFAVLLVSIEIVHVSLFPEWSFVIWGTDVFQALALIPYFFAGALLSFSEFERFFNLQWAMLLAFIAGIFVCGQYWIYEAVVFLVLPYITLSCSLAAPAVFGRLFAENDYSYGLYLWGFPVQQTLVSILGAQALPIVPYTFLSFIVALLCAMVSWHLVEKPCNKLGKRITAWSRARQQARNISA